MIKFWKFFGLPSSEKILLFKAVFYLLCYRIKLIFIPPKVLFHKNITTPRVRREDALQFSPERIVSAIKQASRVVPFSTCLSKALASAVLFSANNHHSVLHIGVLMNGNKQLEAHAWLSYQGRVVLGNLPNLSEYRELPISSGKNQE